VLGVSPFNIVPPLLHAHLHLQAAVIRTNGQSLKTLKKKAVLFGKSGSNE